GFPPEPRAALPRRQRYKHIESLEPRQMMAVVDVVAQNYSVAEGSLAFYTFQLSTPVAQNVVVNYATQDGSAIGGSDYSTTVGSVTIFAGQTSATTSVSTINDSVVEYDESYSLSITGATNAAIGVSTASTTIVDNDRAVWIEDAG